MEGWWKDLRYAARTLRRSPGFSAVAVAVLALGIGANSAIFSVVDAVLLRPLPIPEPERVVAVGETVRRETVEWRPVSYPDFLDWRAGAGVFSEIAAWADTSYTLTSADPAERLEGELVSASYFPLLGVRAERGRTFHPDEDQTPGTHPVAVVSHDLWQRLLGGDPGVVGRPIELNGRSLTIVGITPAGFRGLADDTEVWLPMMMGEVTDRGGALERRGQRWHLAVARLAPGVTIEGAQAAMDAISRRLERDYPDSNESYGARVTSLAEETVGPLKPVLLVLLGAVAFVLLIACTNVANLLLARATAQRRQTAIRAALGAGRGRLVRHFLAEGLILAAAGGVLGTLLAVWLVDLLVLLSPVEFPSFVDLGLDGRVLAFTAAVVLLAGLLLGLVPAFQASPPNLNRELKEGGRTSGAGARQSRARGFLVVAEVAIALLLLIGAGLMIRSFQRMQEIDPGFDAEGLLAMRVSLPVARAEGEGAAKFAAELVGRVGALPGVAAAAVTSDIPLEGSTSATHVTVEDKEPGSPERNLRTYTHSVTPRFFATAGIPLAAGRDFTADDGPGKPPVAIVSATFARRTWPDGSAVGKRIRFGRREDSEEPWMTVVGVAGEVKHRVLIADPQQNPDDPDLYLPLAQGAEADLGLLVRTAIDPAALAASVREEVRALDPDAPLFAVGTVRELVDDQTARSRFATFLMGTFGLLALLLAAIGVYGVLSTSVANRRHEIGVRVAVGARPADVLRLVVGQGLALTSAGVALGLVGAAALTRFLASQLYEVSPTDAATFAGIPLLLAAVAVAATWLPARRASKVDPLEALKAD